MNTTESSDKKPATPLMQQYFSIKDQHPEALLLFQVGDFYELFFDDAKRAAAFLGIALTKRGHINGEPIPLCGVPLHAVDHYITKLVKGGFRVVLCDQLEAPQPGKVVQRGVTQVLTPGTLTDAKLLDEKSASYLLTFVPLENAWGLVFGELLTAQLFATTIPVNQEKSLEAELARFFPDEVVLPNTKQAQQLQSFFKARGYATSFEHADYQDDAVAHDAREWVQQTFAADTVVVVQQQEALRCALTTFFSYLRKNQAQALTQFSSLQLYQTDDFLHLDAATQRNLELVANSQDGSRAHTLFSLLDGAATPMGSRMIKKWLLRPLIKKEAIEQRHEVVEKWVNNISFMQQVGGLLKQLGDVERIVGRIGLQRAPVHDYRTLGQSLTLLPEIKQLLYPYQALPLVRVIAHYLGDFIYMQQLLNAAFDDGASGYTIRPGFDAQLDELRELVEHAQQKILELEAQEQQKTGINSLKIRYTQGHGYYIEITKANGDFVPSHYVRQQSLVGRERYMIAELQTLQNNILTARQRIDQEEKAVFDRVKEQILRELSALRKLAHAVAHLDALYGFASVAYNNNYVRPTFHAGRDIAIVQGRHPVIEQLGRSAFIPNDAQLSNEQSLWIITGPNMGGKSTFLRQVALICLMAQCGSFVPAQKADLALLDRIFTRIGSGDNLAGGKSTFLVEMEETAAICTQATEKSLVILDEVGRGTSTFDGLAIAQAVVEYMHTAVRARCLFATHYHELTHLQDIHPGIVSYYASSKKTAQGILFLYKMVRGVADGSFGLEVARLASLPPQLIKRASAILAELTSAEERTMLPASHSVMGPEKDHESVVKMRLLEERCQRQEQQLELLKAINFDDLSPKKAFDILWQIKENSY